MSLFKSMISCRVTENTKKMVEEIINSDPEIFGEMSDVIRIAIIRLHKQKNPNSKLKIESRIN